MLEVSFSHVRGQLRPSGRPPHPPQVSDVRSGYSSEAVKRGSIIKADVVQTILLISISTQPAVKQHRFGLHHA